VNGNFKAFRHAPADILLPGLSRTLKHRQFFETTSFTTKGHEEDTGSGDTHEQHGDEKSSGSDRSGDTGGDCQMPEKDARGREWSKVTQDEFCELLDKNHYLLDKCKKSDDTACNGINEQNKWHLWLKCADLSEEEKAGYPCQDNPLGQHKKLKAWLTRDTEDPTKGDPSFQGDFSLGASEGLPVHQIHPSDPHANGFCGIAHQVYLPSLNEHGSQDASSEAVQKAFEGTVPGESQTQGLDLMAVVRKAKDGKWELVPQIELTSHRRDETLNAEDPLVLEIAGCKAELQ